MRFYECILTDSMFVSSNRKSPRAPISYEFLIFMMRFTTALNICSTQWKDVKAVNNFCTITYNAGYKIGLYSDPKCKM